MVVALARNLRKIRSMISPRTVVLLLLAAALAAPSLSNAAMVATPAPADPNITLWRIQRAPATPLDQIPLYSLTSEAPQALPALEAEIERLYVHAKSLPSGSARWEFQTRIYRLEKQLDPLQKEFSAERWEILRAAVKLEWLAVQATLAPVVPAAILAAAPAA